MFCPFWPVNNYFIFFDQCIQIFPKFIILFHFILRKYFIVFLIFIQSIELSSRISKSPSPNLSSVYARPRGYENGSIGAGGRKSTAPIKSAKFVQENYASLSSLLIPLLFSLILT
jgi:hypothetical protein